MLQRELDYLVSHNNGTKKSLEVEFPLGIVRMLESLGYINTGLERDGSLSWKATSQAKEDYRIFFSKPTLPQRIDNLFAYYILRLKVA